MEQGFLSYCALGGSPHGARIPILLRPRRQPTWSKDSYPTAPSAAAHMEQGFLSCCAPGYRRGEASVPKLYICRNKRRPSRLHAMLRRLRAPDAPVVGAGATIVGARARCIGPPPGARFYNRRIYETNMRRARSMRWVSTRATAAWRWASVGWPDSQTPVSRHNSWGSVRA